MEIEDNCINWENQNYELIEKLHSVIGWTILEAAKSSDSKGYLDSNYFSSTFGCEHFDVEWERNSDLNPFKMLIKSQELDLIDGKNWDCLEDTINRALTGKSSYQPIKISLVHLIEYQDEYKATMDCSGLYFNVYVNQDEESSVKPIITLIGIVAIFCIFYAMNYK